MFRDTAIIFFFAFFAQDLSGSLSQNIVTQKGKRVDTQAPPVIDPQQVTLYEIWIEVDKPDFNRKVNWNEGMATTLKVLVQEKLQSLANWEQKRMVLSKKFKQIGSRLFYIEAKATRNWFSAANTCRQMGGQLATIQSREELNLIVPQLKRNTGYWLDLNDLSEEGEFVSSASGEPASFLNWRKGQPDNFNRNEHCVALINSYIYDSPCYGERRFICEAKVIV